MCSIRGACVLKNLAEKVSGSCVTLDATLRRQVLSATASYMALVHPWAIIRKFSSSISCHRYASSGGHQRLTREGIHAHRGVADGHQVPGERPARGCLVLDPVIGGVRQVRPERLALGLVLLQEPTQVKDPRRHPTALEVGVIEDRGHEL